jgi:hypothetical protein
MNQAYRIVNKPQPGNIKTMIDLHVHVHFKWFLTQLGLYPYQSGKTESNADILDLGEQLSVGVTCEYLLRTEWKLTCCCNELLRVEPCTQNYKVNMYK